MSPNFQISIIAAIANNFAIGKDCKLLWHLPKDFAFFKHHTREKTVIMGRNTWLSLPSKPLPQRRNVIISQTLISSLRPNIECYQSIEQIKWSEGENFIIGGASLYKHFLPLCDTLYLTQVNAQPLADTFFPPINFNQWKILHRENHQIDAKHHFDFTCTIYRRKTAGCKFRNPLQNDLKEN